MKIADPELKRLLLASGKVKPAALATAEKAHDQSKEPLMATLIKQHVISERDLAKLYAKSLYLPFVELKDLKIPHETLTKIPERIARKYQAVLFGTEDGKLQLAMSDPEDFQASNFIQKQTGSDLKIYMTTSADIAAALDQYRSNIEGEITKAIKDSGEEESKSAQVSSIEITEDSPIAKTVNIILEYAIKSRASDVHIEPRETIVQVRYRVDGVLRETMTLPRPILPAVVSRIKILANLKIDEHRIPQDGRFKVTVGSKTVALRVSTLPVMDGEKVVMRLLDESSRALTLEELGFEGNSLESIKKGLEKPHGMILATGPTGSGKSTTLYSVLSLMNTPGVNISTIEDPVEYRIQGVNQTQVNPKAGMTFANGLRALLRQDPNVIMVGEIRDSETADLAVQAALTGHIVLSTLHTNNAATTLPRLLDMKIEPFLIASTVNTVIGQRLVRMLCAKCRVAYTPAGTELEDIKTNFQVEAALQYLQTLAPAPATKEVKSEAPASKRRREKVIEPTHEIKEKKSILDRIAEDPNIINRGLKEAAQKKAAEQTDTPSDKKLAVAGEIDLEKLKKGELVLYKAGPGCDECGHASYQGRVGIHEVLSVDETIGKLIVSHATSEDIQAAAVKNGMLTMQQDGFVKALRGLTTIEEIFRVTKE